MIEIKPNDVLLFRESRDFTAGENHVALTQEPLPHTIAGAIMSLVYFSRPGLLNLDERRKLLEMSEPHLWKPGFSIMGAFFGLGEKTLFPVPKDVVNVDGELVSLVPHPSLKEVVVANAKRQTLHFRQATGFFDEDELKRYLDGWTGSFSGIAKNSVYELEERIGIGLDEKRVTREGLLYRTVNLRLGEKARILVYFDENEGEVVEAIGDRGVMKLGGEGRFAVFEHSEGDFPISGKVTAGKNEILRLYFATPMIPQNPAKGPDEILKELGIDGEVIKVFTGRKVRVTGWDLMAKMPKETLYAYPAGTVVWVKVNEDTTPDRIMKAGLMTAFGYGLVLTGVLKWKGF